MDKTRIDKAQIEAFVTAFVYSEDNRIPPELAQSAGLSGMQMFDEPLIAYGDAFDMRFSELRHIPEAQAPLMPPCEWLPSAQTVISCFFPIFSAVCISNRDGMEPSRAWMHARIEGNKALFALARSLCAYIEQGGYECLAPVQDERYFEISSNAMDGPLFFTNWSERHVAYLCGLGTFSLSKGLITEKGVAGRLFSVVTSLELESTVPQYSGLFDYCINCRACVGRCPQGAIDEYHLKDDRLCKAKLDKVRDRNPPYYGCAKCHVGVPCEFENPSHWKA